MPRGAPDFANRKALETIYGVFDLGELAARLGSIVTFDRGGNVFFLDDFEKGLAKWETLATLPGGTVTLSSECARSGGFCARIYTGPSQGQYSWIRAFMPYPALGKLGFEFSWSTHTQNPWLSLEIALFTGTQAIIAAIRYSFLNYQIQYSDSTGTWRNLTTGLQLQKGRQLFHLVKLVINLDTHEYERLRFDTETYSMAGLPLGVTPNTTIPHLRVTIRNTVELVGNQLLYVDDMIITFNEV